jgi:hypothetical protein
VWVSMQVSWDQTLPFSPAKICKLVLLRLACSALKKFYLYMAYYSHNNHVPNGLVNYSLEKFELRRLPEWMEWT